MFIANSFDEFKQIFVRQLKEMLSADELGAFILVLANSRQDDFLKDTLSDEVTGVFKKLRESFINNRIKATPEDTDVFKQLMDADIKAIDSWRIEAVGEWELVFNSMRRLRPARASSEVLTTTKQAFCSKRFHFNKPFLKPEILWQGVYKETHIKVLFNKFPFANYHLLIVVSPEENLPQQLTPQSHALIFQLVSEYGVIFPGFGIGFNSLAAGASVNHLHFQGFVRDERFPIEDARWQHNGGSECYPLRVRVFDDCDAAWQQISLLIREDVAFNCIYRADYCYLIARQYQGTVDVPDWLKGAGCLDMAGVITISDGLLLENINAAAVSMALKQLAV